MSISRSPPSRIYFGAKKPLKSIEDFKGMKLRVNATPAERARMGALGATAVPMGLPEMITSLQNGVIDGTMSGMSIYTNFNLQNVGKTLLETHDTLLISFGGLSKAWLDKLPPDLEQDHRGGSAQACSHGLARPRLTRSRRCAKVWTEQRGGEIVDAASGRAGRAARSACGRSASKSPRTIRR